MKKYNEGYALPFVLVVFLVITLVATSVLAVSLRNLQSQKASVQRMEEQYEVQGEVEKIVASINSLIQMDGVSETEKMQISQSIVGNALNVVKEGTIAKLDTDGGWGHQTSEGVSFSIRVTKGNYQIDFTLEIKGAVSYDSIQESYSISSPIVVYNAYTITTIEGGVTE